ncbi:MAG TPA: DUF4249 domain-containing protein [Chryseolinea sp.]|nr:DUF4249 domain-containing protein [Chryseolinea sp.]
MFIFPGAHITLWIWDVALMTETHTRGFFMARSYTRLRRSSRLLSGLLLMCLACVDPFAPNVLSIDYGILVIDGYFVPNDTTRIRLSRTVTMDSPVSTANEPPAIVRIEGDNGFAITLTPHDAQLYTAPPVNVDYQAQYRLMVRTSDGREYSSEYVPLAPKTTIDSLAVNEEPGSEIIGFSVFSHDTKNASRYYSYQYDETWEYIAAGYSQYEFKNGIVVPRRVASELYNCWRTRASSDIRLTTTAQLSEDVVYDFQIAEMRQSDRRLYFAYSILVRQYVLTPDAYHYWRILKQNSEELGTLFDPLPSQPDGNYTSTTDLGRPVIGFFTASEVSTQRVLVTRSELQGPTELYQSDGYEGCGAVLLSPGDMTADNLAGKLIVQAKLADVTSELRGYEVMPAYCLDCRLRGGTTVRPDYWR